MGKMGEEMGRKMSRKMEEEDERGEDCVQNEICVKWSSCFETQMEKRREEIYGRRKVRLPQ
jgi:hypothetical protein